MAGMQVWQVCWYGWYAYAPTTIAIFEGIASHYHHVLRCFVSGSREI